MAEFTRQTTYSITCPFCDSDHVRRDGFQSGQQRYECAKCQRKFRANGKAPGRKVDADIVGAAVHDYYAGKSYKQIAETMAKEYDIPEPSKATIFEWVRDYTEKATEQIKGLDLSTGDHWVADEMSVDVGGGKAWLWNVMDGETRYILATHLARERNADAARTVLRKALETAGKPPDSFFSDKLRSYGPALRDVLPDAKHFKSEGLTAEINNNLSERLQGTFRDRIKTLRGLDTIESGQRYLDGWTLNYNLFRKHHSLRNRTPGTVAKAKPPFTEWADVVKGRHTIKPQITEMRRPQRVKDPTPKMKAIQKPKAASPAKTVRHHSRLYSSTQKALRRVA